ncbi:MAG TPA: serine/threonine-protein kinase, partial [Kofleriaceae bacterium]|nr:serine/threonine-protein kinase [Kofleriaceae bacterium]
MSASEPAHEAPRRASCPTCKAVFRGDFRRCSNCGTVLVLGGPDPLVGNVLAERYLIEQVIGDGGLGRVYRARHVRMSRRFAIKVPFGDVGYDRKARARLSNEAEAASRLDHPNVIGIVDVGETAEGLFYLAMDLAEGQSLADALADGPLPTAEALSYLEQICAGLAHAHDRGLIHRDLKPDNIVVSETSDGRPLVQIIDFGLAMIADAEGSRLTTDGLVVGTPYYMAPEQSTDEALDHRTDLFALGIILYELLAGNLPFEGTPTSVARQNLAVELPTVFERSGRVVDPLLDGLIGWLTRKRPDERPGGARVVGEIARLIQAGDRAAARALLPETLRPAPAEAAPLAARATPDGGA